MEVAELIGLPIAAFVAGAINAVAGGGSLVTFPALVAAGYPARTANVTSAVALWPGYLGGSLGYRSELGLQRGRIAVLLAPCVLGAIIGSAILLSTSEDAFEAIVPFLILFAVFLMLFQDKLSAFAETHHLASQGDDHVPLAMQAVMFLLAVYGAYFGAGLGIMTLAAYSILLPDDLQHSNALKGMTSLLINAVAVVYFVAFGPVEWAPAVLMAGGAVAGGYLGVGVARRLGTVWLRWAIITYGLLVAVVLLVRL